MRQPCEAQPTVRSMPREPIFMDSISAHVAPFPLALDARCSLSSVDRCGARRWWRSPFYYGYGPRTRSLAQSQVTLDQDRGLAGCFHMASAAAPDTTGARGGRSSRSPAAGWWSRARLLSMLGTDRRDLQRPGMRRARGDRGSEPGVVGPADARCAARRWAQRTASRRQ